MEYEVFADEFFIDKRFLGIGCLFVSIDKKVELVNSLINMRCLGPSGKFNWNFDECPFNSSCKRRYHESNNCEIHYRRTDNSSSHPKKEISKKWINFLINNNLKDKKLIYFKILYINLQNLDETVFGDEGVHENIYNRFFRTSIKGSRFFFGKNLKEIVGIYHDKGDSHQVHPYFPWHAGTRLNIDEEDFHVTDEEIKFVDSDHKSYSGTDDDDLMIESQLIQFVDLIIGTVSRNIFNGLSNDKVKICLAERMRPLVERLLKSPNNPNSRYHYFKKQSIDFFPKKKIQQLSLFGEFNDGKESNEFYKVKKLTRLPPCNNVRGPLDEWFR
jgi:hypothetical protein